MSRTDTNDRAIQDGQTPDSAMRDSAMLSMIQRSIGDQPTPPATDALLARIQASRAAGDRVILSGDTLPPFPDAERDARDEHPSAMDLEGRRSRRWSRPAMAAAAAVAFTVVSIWPAASTDTTPSLRHDAALTIAATDPADSANDMLDGLSLFPAVAYAQLPTPSAPDTRLLVSDARLEPWNEATVTTYSMGDTVSGVVSTTQTSLARATYRGAAVWQLVTSTVGRSVSVDTLLLSSGDLRPIARHWHTGGRKLRMHVEERFGGTPSNRKVMVRRVEREGQAAKIDTFTTAKDTTGGVMLANDAQLQLILRTIPLRNGWGFTFNEGRLASGVHTRVRIVGDSVVRTPWTTIPVWRMVFEGTKGAPSARRFIWYVSKASGAVVRSTRAGVHWNPRGEIDDRYETTVIGSR